ncbi:hypothetical protein [Bradyrhizobium betae]|uniref:Uncharacterized protein n=1 Tax=Bradyrhizobium betae TaxID=244734 RepID=A0A5P6PER7_9BRAD|nr:hypothetical protein [Bradyrhizobium betae]MCS3726167.1 hypothetical protein [Bradyrhizobium betae]QFI76756.1 hypothetical protein F8237_32760 [Bradyrhizobium betae]
MSVTIAVTGCVFVGQAVAAAAAADDIFACYKTGPAAEPNWSAVARDYAHKRFKRDCSPERPIAAVAPRLRAMPAPPHALAVKALARPESGSDLIWFVRKDFADVDLFGRPQPNEKATGAEVSWSRNNTAADTIWQVNGLVGLAYSYLNEDYSPFIGLSLASYVKVDREAHSAAASDDNRDAVTIGGSGEIGFINPIGGADYVRGSWLETRDGTLDRVTGQAKLEWMPIYLRVNRQIPGTFVTTNFRPELKVQYDERQGGLAPIGFSGLGRSLRIGPEATFLFRVTDFGATLPGWAEPLAGLSGAVTYHWWREIYSGQSGSRLDSTLKYDINPNVALAFSYQKGRDEETAKRTDLYKLSLNFKTCAAFASFSGERCSAQKE